MPKANNTALEVVMELHLDVGMTYSDESKDGVGRQTAFQEVLDLLDVALKPPLKTKGTVVIRFASIGMKDA